MKPSFFIDNSIDRATQFTFRLALVIAGVLIALVITYLVLTTNSSLQIPVVMDKERGFIEVLTVFPGSTVLLVLSFDIPFHTRYLKYNLSNHDS